MSKEKLARGLVGGALTLRYLKEMKENYEKGDWAEAAKDTAFFSIAIAPVAAPSLFWNAVYPVAAGYAVGIGATAVIAEATGIGEWEEVIFEMGLYPVETIKDWPGVVLPAIKSEITDPIITYLEEDIWADQLVKPISEWWSGLF